MLFPVKTNVSGTCFSVNFFQVSNKYTSNSKCFVTICTWKKFPTTMFLFYVSQKVSFHSKYFTAVITAVLCRFTLVITCWWVRCMWEAWRPTLHVCEVLIQVSLCYKLLCTLWTRILYFWMAFLLIMLLLRLM